MDKTKRTVAIVIFAILSLALFIGTIIVKAPSEHGSVGELMKDAVLHETNRVDLFGIIEVNPGLISAFAVTAFFLVFSLAVRFFVIPKFKLIPGKFQMLLEMAVGFFDGLAKSNSHHRNKFLGAYLFSAGAYIFVSTIFELLGLQVVTTHGTSMSLPAPLADINGAIMMGFLSYAVILSGGIAENKLLGVGRTLKEFSLPVSMSFRIFGALLSGALVTELVYHYISLSYGLPILIAVLFTLLHALVQTYVLSMLTALFYGEVSEPVEPKEKIKKKKQKRNKNTDSEGLSVQ
jgi:F-type H+-transporting ATPase subunit a